MSNTPNTSLGKPWGWAVLGNNNSTPVLYLHNIAILLKLIPTNSKHKIGQQQKNYYKFYKFYYKYKVCSLTLPIWLITLQLLHYTLHAV